MAEYEFRCPKCGDTHLNEIMVDVTVDSEIDRVTDRGDGIVYGDQTNEDGRVVSICCRSCGIILMLDGGVGCGTRTRITTHEELIEWLKKNEKQK